MLPARSRTYLKLHLQLRRPSGQPQASMAQQAKGDYEAAPLLDDAEAGVPEQAPRKWHGHLLAPCGPSCDALGWSTCLVRLEHGCVNGCFTGGVARVVLQVLSCE